MEIDSSTRDLERQIKLIKEQLDKQSKQESPPSLSQQKQQHKAKTSNPANGQVRYYNCNKPGHKAYDCRLSKKKADELAMTDRMYMGHKE